MAEKDGRPNIELSEFRKGDATFAAADESMAQDEFKDDKSFFIEQVDKISMEIESYKAGDAYTIEILNFLNRVTLAIYKQEWSYDYCKNGKIMSISELYNLLNIYLYQSHLPDKKVGYYIMKEYAFFPRVNAQKIGKNLKKIYDRYFMSIEKPVQFEIKVAQMKSAQYVSASGLNIRQNAARIPVLGRLIGLCRTTECTELDEYRDVFQADLEPLIKYVNLYDVCSKTQLHQAMIFMKKQYEKSDAFTLVLSGQLVDLNVFYNFIKFVDATYDEYLIPELQSLWIEYESVKTEETKQAFLKMFVTHLNSSFGRSDGGKRKRKRICKSCKNCKNCNYCKNCKHCKNHNQIHRRNATTKRRNQHQTKKSGRKLKTTTRTL